MEINILTPHYQNDILSSDSSVLFDRIWARAKWGQLEFHNIAAIGKVHCWSVSLPVKCYEDYHLLLQKKARRKKKQGSPASSYFMLLLSVYCSGSSRSSERGDKRSVCEEDTTGKNRGASAHFYRGWNVCWLWLCFVHLCILPPRHPTKTMVFAVISYFWEFDKAQTAHIHSHYFAVLMAFIFT